LIWPFCPLDGALDALEFRTDVLRARNSEQRLQLRNLPRRFINAGYRLRPLQYERARSMMRALGPGPFWLPEWNEGTRMAVGAGQTALALDPFVAQYAVGGHVAFASGDGGEVCEIAGIDSDGITLVDGPEQSYANALVAPAFQAWAPAGLGAQHDAQKMPLAAIEWQIFSGADLADGYEPEQTYRGDPLLTQCARVGDGAFDETIVRDVEIVDGGVGPVYFDDVLTQATQTLGAAWMLRKGVAVMSLRRWFYYLRGRQRAFWLPAWNRGVRLAADVSAGAGSIVIASIGFAAGYGSGDLYFRMADGTVHALQVASAVDNGVTETLTLVGTAPAMAAAQVQTGCLLFRVRLAADRIEFAHMAGFGARVQVPCVEVPL
jgi:hypothetical protein